MTRLICTNAANIFQATAANLKAAMLRKDYGKKDVLLHIFLCAQNALRFGNFNFQLKS